VTADAATVLLAAGVPAADFRHAAGMCPELLFVSAVELMLWEGMKLVGSFGGLPT
jgi:hypothetical protein